MGYFFINETAVRFAALDYVLASFILILKNFLFFFQHKASFPLFSLCLEKINFALKKQKSILKILSPKDKIPRYSFA